MSHFWVNLVFSSISLFSSALDTTATCEPLSSVLASVAVESMSCHVSGLWSHTFSLVLLLLMFPPRMHTYKSEHGNLREEMVYEGKVEPWNSVFNTCKLNVCFQHLVIHLSTQNFFVSANCALTQSLLLWNCPLQAEGRERDGKKIEICSQEYWKSQLEVGGILGWGRNLIQGKLPGIYKDDPS